MDTLGLPSLERVQRRSLRIIGLPHNYLTTLEERRSEAASRYLDTILQGSQIILFYQQIINHNKHDYDLRHRHGRLKYIPFSNFVPRVSPSVPKKDPGCDRVAQLAEHWASIPKVVGSIPTVVRHIFQACPVWIYTQSNITSIIFT